MGEFLTVWVHHNDELDSENFFKNLNKEFGNILKINRAFDWQNNWEITFLAADDWNTDLYTKHSAYFLRETTIKNCKYPVGICLLEVNNKSTKTSCEICSKLTIKTPERHLVSFGCLYC